MGYTIIHVYHVLYPIVRYVFQMHRVVSFVMLHMEWMEIIHIVFLAKTQDVIDVDLI
jgi:hypothetical protein